MILCRKGKAEGALSRMRELLGKLKLTVNEEKTRICKVPEGELTFLAYSFARMYSVRTGKAYLGLRPSKKSIKPMAEIIHDSAAPLPRYHFRNWPTSADLRVAQKWVA